VALRVFGPENPSGSPALKPNSLSVVYRNFHAILRWNRSILYALSVGHLSDRLQQVEDYVRGCTSSSEY
jgi:membrane-bound lytic murein transglycosylase B